MDSNILALIVDYLSKVYHIFLVVISTTCKLAHRTSHASADKKETVPSKCSCRMDSPLKNS